MSIEAAFPDQFPVKWKDSVMPQELREWVEGIYQRGAKRGYQRGLSQGTTVFLKQRFGELPIEVAVALIFGGADVLRTSGRTQTTPWPRCANV